MLRSLVGLGDVYKRQVSAPDGNTYIRGRRLLKPISSPNTTSEDTSKEAQHTAQQQAATSAKENSAKRMPRRSPRNHVSTRAADIEIAAQITAIYIRDFEDGTDVVYSGSGSGAQSPDRQPDNHTVKLRVPPSGTARPDNIRYVPLRTSHAVNGLPGTRNLQGGQ